MTRIAMIDVPAPCQFINSNNRLHRMAQAKLTKTWRNATALAAHGTQPFAGQVRPKSPKSSGLCGIIGTAPEVLATPPGA